MKTTVLTALEHLQDILKDPSASERSKLSASKAFMLLLEENADKVRMIQRSQQSYFIGFREPQGAWLFHQANAFLPASNV